MLELIIAILMGLACSGHNTNTNTNNNNNTGTTISTFDDTSGENGQLPPPKID